ncbi:hypothetical protein [Kitasatospora sp. NPDC059803]|uniref:hypothetical protein n=1 Tax=Kitasatospora sp. NPDC059803 TaxID=3346953 RepID=UPI00364F4B9B
MPTSLDKDTRTAPEEEPTGEEPEDAGEDKPEEDGADEEPRRLSEAFTRALPYVAGAHGLKSLVTGSWVIITKTGTWVVEGDAVRVFLPRRADKRDAKKAADAQARKAKQEKKAAKNPKTQEPEQEREAPAGGGHSEPPPWLIRLGGLGLGGYLIAYTGWSSPAWSVPAVLIPWCALAWMHSPAPAPPATEDPAETKEAAGDDGVYEEGEDEEGVDEDEPYDEPQEHETADGTDDEQEPEQPVRLTAAQIADRFRLYVEHTVAARWEEGVRGLRQGVHIEDMLTDLRQRGLIADERWDTQSLGAYLRALGIPLRDPLSLTVSGRKVNRVGVHHDDLAQHLGHTPHPPPHRVPDPTPTAPSPEAATAAPGQSPARPADGPLQKAS